MEWIILFISNWIIFLLLVDWKEFKINMWAGGAGIVLAVVVDFLNTLQHRYIIKSLVIDVFGSSLFFLLGPVFVVATLMAQYHPAKRWMILLNVFVIALLYSLMELILVYRGVVEYINWQYIDSIMVNIGAIVILSWFSMVVLNKKMERS